MLPVIGETMALAAQSLRQSSALASLLIEKGLLTQKELDAAVSKSDPAKKIRDMLLGSEAARLSISGKGRGVIVTASNEGNFCAAG